MSEVTDSRSRTRSKIVAVAARLLQQDGPQAVTTRRVADAAGIQAPTIYRLFGDKDGLLDAVAERVMAEHVSAKAATVAAASAANVDPVEELRAGWQRQIAFGVANPALFRLLSDPDRVLLSPAAQSGKRVLESRVHRVAVAGRLRVGERHAVDLIQAAGIGVIQTLLGTPAEERDLGLADSMLDAVLGRILTETPPRADGAPMAAMIAFRSVAPELDVLSAAERELLTEWLDRAIAAPPTAD